MNLTLQLRTIRADTAGVTRGSSPREVIAERRARPFWLWCVLITVAGLSLAVASVANVELHELAAPEFAVLAALVIGFELRPLLAPGNGDGNGIAVSVAFVFTAMIMYGLDEALLLMAVATVLADWARRKAWWRTAFNIGQYALSYGAAAAVLALLGAGGAPADAHDLSARHVPAMMLAGAAYFLVNNLLVTRLIASHEGIRWWTAFRTDIGFEFVSTAALLTLAPLIVVVLEHSYALAPLLLPALFAVYRNASVAVAREHEALHDSLTGLPNRKLLLSQASRALADRPTAPVALLLLDLDRFKEVNDTLGHGVGDSLLALVGQRLRAAAPTGATVARLGGDEFAVLLTDDAERAQEVAQAVRDGLREPFSVADLRLDIGASLGIAHYPEHAGDFATLMQRADVALYLAKDTRNGIETYSSERDCNSTARLNLLGDLRQALDDGSLTVHYQPKADLLTAQVVGVEALVRWEHPEQGFIPPDLFIPLAEHAGLIRPLTEHVLDTAIAEAAGWAAHGIPLQLAVNISVFDLYAQGFAPYVASRLAAHRLRPELLQLEVTESVLMADPDRAMPTLTALHDLGVTLSLDDFGTGYSSLARLRRLPVTELKIDRSLTARVAEDPDDMAIARSVVDLARALGLSVVAEGVETEDAWRCLRMMGCDLAQGWYLSRPMPADNLLPWLAQRVVPAPQWQPMVSVRSSRGGARTR